MNYSRSLKSILIVGLLLGFTSCVKDADFDLGVEAETLPIVEANLMVNNLGAFDFMDVASEQDGTVYTDTIILNLSTPEFPISQLKETTLNLKLINSLETEFMVEFEFLNELDRLTYSVQVPVYSATLETPIKVETIVFIKEPEITLFKEATKLVYKIRLPKNELPVDSNDIGNLILVSGTTLFFEWE